MTKDKWLPPKATTVRPARRTVLQDPLHRLHEM